MSIAQNRRAHFDYELGERFEAGIVLLGSEVKALRASKVSIAEAYVAIEGGEAWLVNAHIDQLAGTSMGSMDTHQPRRRRKLLLHARQISRIGGEISRGGMTAIALNLYFNERGMVKLGLALGKGRKTHDKRAAIKDREWQRDRARVLSRR